jgi:hypothetical protein
MVAIPRLDRPSALAILEHVLTPDVAALTSAMPDLSPVVTYSPTGGNRITEQELRDLRTAVVGLASSYGMPRPTSNFQEFEGRAARIIHDMLPMTPHEFASEEAWSYITCCWLLDVAVWRFGHDADTRRFVGDINRNTFRRMWWRADVLGAEIDLTQFGEDELVNITERPTVAADRRLARAVAREFLARVDRGEAASRMLLMREAMKRLLRLTPFVAFAALAEPHIQAVVEEIFNAAAAGLAGDTTAKIGRHQLASADFAPVEVPESSSDVVSISRMTISSERPDVAWAPEADPHLADDFDTVAEVALDIAQRAGRVTNEELRAVVPISTDEARAVFRALMATGALVRRGVKRGTHYVIPEQGDVADRVIPGPLGPAAPASSGQIQEPAPTPTASDRSTDTALRRLLRRS